MSGGSIDISSLAIFYFLEGLFNKKIFSAEIARAALAFAEKENPSTNAYLTFSPDRALRTAEKVDAEIASNGFVGALASVPLGVKDVLVTKGLRTTCGSRSLERYIPPYDAT